MNTTLLMTKLFLPPPIPGLVPRPRLLARLDGVLNHKLTIVSAQAGFGKTTLVSQWIHSKQPPLPTAWLSLEEADNDPTRFWDYVIAALQTRYPGVGKEALIYLHSTERVPIESILTSLINDLTAVGEDCILVLDDYQFIHTEAVHKSVTFLLDHLPPKMHLVIATRVDPPLPLSNYRGKGSLLEIRSDDLRFSRDEVSTLLTEIGSPQLSGEEIDVLNGKAEGWVVGLKMAGLVMRGQQDAGPFVSGFTGSQRYIMDYLVDEVLQRQPREIIDFLLQTSVLERMSAPLCDAVTGVKNGQSMLGLLDKANLFLNPLDTTGEWYRYHHLFRDLLRHRLRADYGDDGVAERHRRAGKWYETHGLMEDAIDHALAAQDWEKAMVLIGTPPINTRLLASVIMLNWLKQIPEEILRTNIPVYFSYIWALFYAGQLDDIEGCLNYVDAVTGIDSLFQGSIANVRSVLAAMKGDYLQAEELARKALLILNPHDEDKPLAGHFGDYASASQIAGVTLLNRGEFDEAETFLERALRFTRESGLIQDISQPVAYLGSIAALRGQLHYAAKILHDAIAPYEGDPATAYAHWVLGFIYYEWNDLESSNSHFNQARKLFKLYTYPGIALENNCLYQARTMMVMGELDKAMEFMVEADRVVPDNPDDRAVNLAFHIVIALWQGDTEAVSKWLDILEGYESLPFGLPIFVHYLLNIRKEKAVALQEIQATYERWASKARGSLQIHFKIIWAMLLKEEMDKSMKYFAEALALGEPEGFIRSFVDFGMEITPLLREAVARGIKADYARGLLGVIEAEDRRRRTRKVKTQIASQPSGFLSERETEVLRLMAEGLSNQDIIQKLMVSQNTLKTHVRHIFEKLDTRDRLQAVTRARELKLIQ